MRKVLIAYANRSVLRICKDGFSGLNVEIVSIPLDIFNTEMALLIKPDLIIYGIGTNIPFILRQSIRELCKLDTRQRMYQISVAEQKKALSAFYVNELDAMLSFEGKNTKASVYFENLWAWIDYIHSLKDSDISARKIRQVRTYFRRYRNSRHNRESVNPGRPVTTYSREDVRQLLESDFRIYFQPIFSSMDLKMCAGEILSRRVRINGNKELPHHYIPSIQKEGYMSEFTEKLITSLLKKLQQYNALHIENLFFILNIPAVVLLDHEFQLKILSIFEKFKVDINIIRFELYDYKAVLSREKIASEFDKLRASGIRFGLDGYSPSIVSLQKIKLVQPEFVKFSRSVIRRVRKSTKGIEILNKMIHEVQVLGIHTIVNGVETSDDLAIAQRSGTQLLQGFCLSSPADISVYSDFFRLKSLAEENQEELNQSA